MSLTPAPLARGEQAHHVVGEHVAGVRDPARGHALHREDLREVADPRVALREVHGVDREQRHEQVVAGRVAVADHVASGRTLLELAAHPRERVDADRGHQPEPAQQHVARDARARQLPGAARAAQAAVEHQHPVAGRADQLLLAPADREQPAGKVARHLHRLALQSRRVDARPGREGLRAVEIKEPLHMLHLVAVALGKGLDDRAGHGVLRWVVGLPGPRRGLKPPAHSAKPTEAG